MSTIDLDAELKAAVIAVRDAASVCQSVQKNLVTAATLEKKDRSPVTVADFASQALVCSSLALNSKIQAVVGEEDAAELRESGAEKTRVEQVYKNADEQAGRDVLSYAVRFPLVLLVAFGLITLYFRSRGGYKPVELTTHE